MKVSVLSLQELRRNIKQRQVADQVFMVFALFCLLTGLVVLIALVFQMFFGALGYSFTETAELERSVIGLVTQVDEQADSPAKSQLAELIQVVREVKSQRTGEALLEIKFTDQERQRFNEALLKVLPPVNDFAQKQSEAGFIDDDKERERVLQELDASSPAIKQIYDTTRQVCAGRIERFFTGAWLCIVPSKLTLRFLSLPPSANHEQAGVLVAIAGTSLVILVTSVLAIPIGIAAGVFLEEYAPKNWFTGLIEINITNLAGVPSIIYGLLALGVFKYQLAFGESILTAGCTLGCLILPVIIVTTREAIRAIPVGIREGAAALGASKWQVIWDHILPYSIGGILTGIIVGLSRAIGETAPLITIGALTFITFLPISDDAPFLSLKWIWSPFTVMPIQMFDWVQRPDRGFQTNASAAGVVLVVMTLLMNGAAIYIRAYSRSRIKW
jgi:phosphate transport system permease protein